MKDTHLRSWSVPALLSALLCLVLLSAGPAVASRQSRGLARRLRAQQLEADGDWIPVRREAAEESEDGLDMALPPGSFLMPSDEFPPSETITPPQPPARASPSYSSPSPDLSPAPAYGPTYGAPSPVSPCGHYGYGGNGGYYGVDGGYGCAPVSSYLPPPYYGGYGGYGGNYGSPSPATAPEANPSSGPSPSLPIPKASPEVLDSVDPRPIPMSSSETSPSLDEEPSPPPSRWPHLYAYLEEVVLPEMWPFFKASMDPQFIDAINGTNSRFTLFMPLYEDMLEDPVVLSIFANPADPANAMKLNRVMQYHMVLGRTLQPTDFTDGLELTNMLGGILRVEQRFGKDSSDFFVNGVKIARWQAAGRGLGYWMNGVIHEPVVPSPPMVVAPAELRFASLSEALDAVPELSVLAAVYRGVMVDTLLGPVISALMMGPFTLLAPSNQALEEFMAAQGSTAAGLADKPAADLAAMIAPHIIVGQTGGSFFPLSSLTDGRTIITGVRNFGLIGESLAVKIPTPGSLPVLMITDNVFGAEAGVVRADVFVRSAGTETEGVVHVVDKVLMLLPPGRR